MDDERTRKTLDSLAELFLTGAGHSEKARPGPGAPAGPGPGVSVGVESTETKRTVDSLEGPEPFRLAPKPMGGERFMRSGRAQIGAGGGKPQLRLAGTQPKQAARDERVDVEKSGGTITSASAMVEAVVLGNLPGLSGPWLTQYAQRLADRHGPVAVVHVEAAEVEVELVEPKGQWNGRGRDEAHHGRGHDLVALLEGLVSKGPWPVRTVLLHVDPQEGPHGLGRLLAVDCWTLLCGADDAAVVGAQQMIKRWVDAEPGLARHHLGLMLMGGDEASSRAAAVKIREAAGSFLHMPVELVGWHQRMEPVNVRGLGRFADGDAAWPRLRAWLTTLAEPMDEAGVARAQGQVSVPTAERVAVPTGDVTDEVTGDTTDDTWWDEELAAAAATAAADNEGAGDSPGAAVKDDDEPPADEAEVFVSDTRAPARTGGAGDASGAGQAEVEADEAVDLATFLTRGPGAVAGSVALEARCPHQPQTQLLLDQDGALHLLRRHDGGQGDAAAGLRSAIVDLLAARAWVREHLALLKLTQRQCKFDEQAEPVLHLFTDRADLASGLANRLGGMLRLHLLQKVQLKKESGWVCTGLN